MKTVAPHPYPQFEVTDTQEMAQLVPIAESMGEYFAQNGTYRLPGLDLDQYSKVICNDYLFNRCSSIAQLRLEELKQKLTSASATETNRLEEHQPVS